MTEKTVSLALSQFDEMCRRHDLTFDYSDDGNVYRAGKASLERIHAAAKALPWAEARATWNAAVDRKIVADHRLKWYWPESEPDWHK